MVFLDVTKVFDEVYHTWLLHKLESFGIEDALLGWFKGYLSGRSQRVPLNGKEFSWRPVTACVPEGSIVGPLLFLIFLNYIVDDLKSDPSLFAADTSLLKVINNQSDAISVNEDLCTIKNWAAQWRVTFNPSKTVYMIMHKKLKRPPPSISI